MKSLETLLKVAQRRMDELGVEAARIGTEMAAMRARGSALAAREDNEIRLAAGNVELASLLPAYRLRVKWQRDQIGVEVAKAESTLAEIRERLTAAYQEKSRFQHLIEQEAIRKATERAAKEQAMLDEVAINRAGAVGK